MRIYRRLPTIQSGIATKRQKFWLIAACILASLTLSEPAVAQNLVPVPGVGNGSSGTLSAAQPSTTGSGTFNTNINFGGPNTGPPLLTLTLAPGVIVNSPGGNAVNLANATGGIATIGTSAEIIANNATINDASVPNAPNQSALRIQTNGSAIITASGLISITGTQSTNAIWAIVLANPDPNAVAKVVYNGPGVTSVGTTFSTVIQANNSGTGPSIIEATGNITGVALGSAANGVTGLFASSDTGTNVSASVPLP
jgi:hypothetical protein